VTVVTVEVTVVWR